ncbi:MAG: topoisomerase [Solirubrobacterales bacterium]|nr:topoisomerase [Solirubrobacterales bacterium]
MPRLRRSDCSAPGISRRRRGRGFAYLDRAGERIDDPEVLQRIGELAIPPAWREVWICMDSLGHLQATGLDAAGRKQYLYHERWRAHRDRLKFDSMLAFGRALPRMRRRVSSGLAGEELSRERVLACAVRLLDLGFFRVGSEDYAEQNESYGLSTIQKRHVSLGPREVVFDYPAKSGQRQIQAIADPDVLRVLSALKRRRGGGEKLLAHREDGHWREVRADDVNAYIKSAAGGDFSAKDFRTWNATVLAAIALSAHDGTRPSRTARKRAIGDAIKTVSSYLGNTPAVCRASYVDPRVIDSFQSGTTIAALIERLPHGPDLADERTRTRIERAVLALLDDD